MFTYMKPNSVYVTQLISYLFADLPCTHVGAMKLLKLTFSTKHSIYKQLLICGHFKSLTGVTTAAKSSEHGKERDSSGV